jgi:porphobilinogen synthase
MAIKFGRPIEMRSRLTPVENEAAAGTDRLDLAVRMRRNRRSEWVRRMVREHVLTTGDLIWPLFVMDGSNARTPVPSMPGVERLSVDQVVRQAEHAANLAIPCIALFPYTDPNLRDETGSEALNPDNLVCRAIRDQKGAEIGILCDVALDPSPATAMTACCATAYLNDETVAVLVKQALVKRGRLRHIAPSDMMDGASARSGRLRRRKLC